MFCRNQKDYKIVFTPLSSSNKNQLLAHYCERSDQAIFILDADKRYLSINDAYEKLTGYSEAILLGQPFGIFAIKFLTAYEAKLLKKLNERLDNNDIYEQSFTLPRRDGQIINYTIVFQRFFIDKKPFFLGSVNRLSNKLVAQKTVDFESNSQPSQLTRLADNPLVGLSLGQLVLSQAIANDEFEAFYQPKYRLDTDTIVGFEALVRWQHPTRGLLSPRHFIDEIVYYDLSFALFCKLSAQVAQLLADWQAMGLPQYLSINADAGEFSHPDFNKTVSQLLDTYNIAPYRLHIEMTESSLMPSGEDIKQRLIELKQSKICLALDDFGTGYSSLSYLQDYPFDFIKIDKTFISELTSNQTQQAIVKAILDLSSALGMQTVAEGIETEQQYRLLQQMGCQYGQGYWLGRPVSAKAATQLLQ